MQQTAKSDPRADQMEPHPLADDVSLPRPSGGHGEAIHNHSQRPGIPVNVKLLKSRGVRLSKEERRKAKLIVGELVISRVHDCSLDFQSRAEVFQFTDRGFPSLQGILLDPVVFAADERGMVLYGIEKLQVEGRKESASYAQAWLVRFGAEPPSEPWF